MVINVYIYIHAFIYIYTQCVLCICSYIYICIYTCIHIYIIIYIQWIYIYIHEYIHTYIHTYIHEYIHTYIHTFTWVIKRSWCPARFLKEIRPAILVIWGLKFTTGPCRKGAPQFPIKSHIAKAACQRQAMGWNMKSVQKSPRKEL